MGMRLAKVRLVALMLATLGHLVGKYVFAKHLRWRFLLLRHHEVSTLLRLGWERRRKSTSGRLTRVHITKRLLIHDMRLGLFEAMLLARVRPASQLLRTQQFSVGLQLKHTLLLAMVQIVLLFRESTAVNGVLVLRPRHSACLSFILHICQVVTDVNAILFHAHVTLLEKIA